MGAPLGPLGGPLGVDGGPLETTLGKQAALQNHWFYCINGYIWALERGLGGPWGGEVEAKTGGEELSGDRGAHNKPKTKRAGADEEKKGPKGHPSGIPIIDPGPPLGRSIGFTSIRPMFLLASLGRSKVLLGASGGGPWGAQGFPEGLLVGPLGGSGPSLGGPWGTLGQPWEAEGRPQRALLENRRLCKIIGFTA